MRLKSQISLLLTTLIVVAITATAGILVYQSKQDISNDIYLNARNYTELTAERMYGLTQEYLPSQSFLVFNPLMQDLLRKNDDVTDVQVYNFSGALDYDSKTESKEQYLGDEREGYSSNEAYLQRIQAQNPSIRTTAGEIFYIKKLDSTSYKFVNEEGTNLRTQPDSRSFQVQDLVFPVANEAAVVYEVSYHNLLARLQRAAINIGIVALAAILFSILVGMLFAGTLTRPLRKLTKTVGLIAGGDLDQHVDIKSNDEVGILAKAVNKMTADLKKSIEARIFQEKTEKELEIAKSIQQAILPKELPETEALDISAQLNSAEAVSGDVYDVIEVDNEKGHYMYAYLGDVTGHGIGASLLSSTANAMIAMLAPEEPDPKQLLTKVNNTLKAKTSGTVFITLALMKYDFKTKKLTHVQAGHEPVLKFAADGGEVEELEAGGIALGMLPDIGEQLAEVEIKLSPGDSAIMYSDGLPEAWQNEKKNWGMDAFKKAYRKHGSLKSAESIQKALFKSVNDFRKGFEQKDDMTLIVIRQD